MSVAQQGRISERIRVIDADTHISEPPDLWTSRVSTKKWGDLVPHVRRDPKWNEDRWWFGDVRGSTVATFCMAGYSDFPPLHPKTLEEGDPACHDPTARLERMDQYGIWSQVLYPNVIGFSAQSFLGLKEPELMLECVRAYNDFLIDFSSVAPDRFIPIMALPFWDVDASVHEMKRSRERGHLGVLFGSEFEHFNRPRLADPHWDPIWSAAQDLGLSINFHVGSGGPDKLREPFPERMGRQTHYAEVTTLFFLGNARAISEVLLSGICERYPSLRFVSVESGIGWIPFLIESLDWQWKNSGAFKEHPDRELPSHYFRRQVYGCFWFETEQIDSALLQYPENFLFETDFPHPTSMSPGPASFAEVPADFIDKHLAHLPEHVLKNVLHDNAARIYGLPPAE